MKAPNKIYLQACGSCVIEIDCNDCQWKDLASNVTWSEDRIFQKDIEYIRKDALLEWAKSQKARLKQGHKHDWKNDDILFGGTLILDNLIEKIESL